MANENELSQVQKSIANAGARWRAGHTTVSSLNEGEKQRKLGYIPGPNDPSLKEQESRGASKLAEHKASLSAFSAVSVPASVDWRTGGFVTAVKDQGGCGSCVAFGSIAALESQIKIQRGAAYDVDLSEAQLFYCIARSLGRTCENGWWPEAALIGMRDTGITDEACYPYTAGDQDCTGKCADWQNRVTKITGYEYLNSIADIKEFVSSHGPVEACFTVYNDFFSYTSGVYEHVTGDVAGGHCVCIVGYDDVQGCWICKNSWGTGWGMSGFFNIAYGQCGIEGQVYGITGVDNTYWINGKKVIGLWANSDERNAWAYLSDLGWRKISPNNDGGFLHTLTQLSSAKLSGASINVHIVDGVIETLYAF